MCGGGDCFFFFFSFDCLCVCVLGGGARAVKGGWGCFYGCMYGVREKEHVVSENNHCVNTIDRICFENNERQVLKTRGRVVIILLFISRTGLQVHAISYPSHQVGH